MKNETYKAQRYHAKVALAMKAGFEWYCNTTNDDDVSGEIYVAPHGNKYFGETLDIFEDGTHIHGVQFKGQKTKFQFAN